MQDKTKETISTNEEIYAASVSLKKKTSLARKFFKENPTKISEAIFQVPYPKSNDKICGTIVSRGGILPANYSVSNLKKHLKSIHPETFKN